jgi:hypothetical protein
MPPRSKAAWALLAAAAVVTMIAWWIRTRSAAPDGRRANEITRIEPSAPERARLGTSPQAPEPGARVQSPPSTPPGSSEKRPPSVYEGVVIDAATQGPVPDVVIQLAAAWSLEGTAPPAFTTTSSAGRFRVGVEGDRTVRTVPDVAPRQGWERIGWTIEGNDDSHVLPEDGAVAHVVLRVRAAYGVTGLVRDETGKPVARATAEHLVVLDVRGGESTLGHRTVVADAEGRFQVGPFPMDPKVGVVRPAPAGPELVVHADGFAPTIVDLSEVTPPSRDALVVTLRRGRTVSGVVVDARGNPVRDAPIAVEYRSSSRSRQGTRTDGAGAFRFEHLPVGDATIRAWAPSRDAKASLGLASATGEVRLVLEEIRLSTPPRTTRVLGLAVADADDEMRAAYDLPAGVSVVVLGVEERAQHLGIGSLEPGDGIWMVGEDVVTSVRDFVARLVVAAAAKPYDERRRIVYSFWRDTTAGTNTQYLELDAADGVEVRSLAR